MNQPRRAVRFPLPLAAVLALALAGASSAGCFVGRTQVSAPLSRQRLAELHPGTTTAAEVVELLGAPTEVVQLGHRSAYRYEYELQKQAGLYLLVVVLFNNDQKSDRAWIFFDEHGTLTHVGATLGAEDAAWNMPWGG
jgi:outer membrane protein assembly factor BamE (lipoprotein component of BamABCDE complex)